MKQYAEEKFSATSLSATNIRNENTKSRVKKDFKELYSNTPIRFGSMEAANFCHAGVEPVIIAMMIHSLSPQGRRLVEQMYTGDPYNINIQLDSNSKNRGAEIANTYLKTIGRRLVFKKVLKERNFVGFNAITFNHDPYEYPIFFVQEDKREGFDYIKDFKDRQKLLKKVKEKGESPITFMGIDRKRRAEWAKEREELKKEKELEENNKK